MSGGVWSAGLSEYHSGLEESTSLNHCSYPFNHHPLFILALTGRFSLQNTYNWLLGCFSLQRIYITRLLGCFSLQRIHITRLLGCFSLQRIHITRLLGCFSLQRIHINRLLRRFAPLLM